jgi:hypothetical protein
VTFLALCTTDFLNGYAIQFVILHVIMKLLVNAVKLIAAAVCFIVKSTAQVVAIDTPTHAQV